VAHSGVNPKKNCDMGQPNHKSTTKETILEMVERGYSVNQLGRMFRGIIDRRTIQLWVKAAKDH